MKNGIDFRVWDDSIRTREETLELSDSRQVEWKTEIINEHDTCHELSRVWESARISHVKPSYISLHKYRLAEAEVRLNPEEDGENGRQIMI